MQADFCTEIDLPQEIRGLPQNLICHMVNVSIYVRKMSQLMVGCQHFSADPQAPQFPLFGRAAFYHDIGKIWVPREILVKPARLTEEEMAEMRRHPLYGLRFLGAHPNETVPGLPQQLLPLIYDAVGYHHEWWDGSGYPFGLRGEAAPLIARVTAICDAYDAITGTRAYRTGQPHEVACAELKRCSGTQFDPRLVDMFLAHEAEFTGLGRRVCTQPPKK